jgi:hypothetical protein
MKKQPGILSHNAVLSSVRLKIIQYMGKIFVCDENFKLTQINEGGYSFNHNKSW